MSLPSLLPDDTRNPGVRGLIACVFSFVAFLGFWAVHAWAQSEPWALAHYVPEALAVVQAGLLLAMACTVVLGLVCWRARSSGVAPAWLTASITVSLSLAYVLLGLAYGIYTTPMSFVIMGVIAFGVVFFDRRAVLAGMAVSLVVFACNEVLMAQGVLAYAPLLTGSPVAADGTLAPWWGIHLRVIFIVGFCAFCALLLFQVEQLEAQRRALHDLAVTDPLTRVANRRRFGERLDEEIQRRQRSGRPLCVMVCDADHFKKVNDTWGHAAGDEVLKHIAAVLNEGVRTDIDLVGRLGGEEFGVILPETALPEALEIAARIGAQLRAHEFSADTARFHVTLSMGVAESRIGSGEDALRVADGFLYEAKQGGRDRALGGLLA